MRSFLNKPSENVWSQYSRQSLATCTCWFEQSGAYGPHLPLDSFWLHCVQILDLVQQASTYKQLKKGANEGMLRTSWQILASKNENDLLQRQKLSTVASLSLSSWQLTLSHWKFSSTFPYFVKRRYVSSLHWLTHIADGSPAERAVHIHRVEGSSWTRMWSHSASHCCERYHKWAARATESDPDGQKSDWQALGIRLPRLLVLVNTVLPTPLSSTSEASLYLPYRGSKLMKMPLRQQMVTRIVYWLRVMDMDQQIDQKICGVNCSGYFGIFSRACCRTLRLILEDCISAR